MVEPNYKELVIEDRDSDGPGVGIVAFLDREVLG